MPDVDGAERLARLIRIEEQVESLRREFGLELRQVKDDVGEIRRAIEGPPRNESIRGRLHMLETSDAAALAAKAAIDAARLMQDRSWTRKERAGLFVIAMIGALGTIISTVVLVIQISG